MSLDHDELRDLVAASALDAVGEEEERLVLDHVRTCARCRADLISFREVAARLSYAGEEAPSGVWQRIAEATAPSPRPPLQVLVGTGRPGRRLRMRLAGGVAAAAVAAGFALLAVGVVNQSGRIDQLQSAVAQARMDRSLMALALDPSARRADLTSATGATVAVVARRPDGSAYLVPLLLPGLPTDRTYQAWTIRGGHARSIGLLGPGTDVLAFRAPAAPVTVAVTVEPRGGSVQPSGAPIASGQVS